MINTAFSEASYLKTIEENRKNNPGPILYSDDFLFNMLDQMAKKDNRTYPYQVKIAKPIDDLLKGDFTPAKTITITAPLLYKGHEIWSGSTLKDVELQFGYENGDKRFLSQFVLDMNDKPHMAIAGSTGSGKSVFTNSLIAAMLFRYPPWELELVMSDAKIVEYKRYGTGHRVPHIKSIAATSDGGFLVSVINNYLEEHEKYSDFFGNIGVKDLAGAREKLGMVIPRHVYFGEEFTAMMEAYKSKANEIVRTIGQIGRLGRSSGHHMILISQTIDSNFSNCISNIPVRACLRCNDAKDAIRVIGNDQGALGDVGIGKVYVNQEVARGSKDDNHKFRTPFQSDKKFEEQTKFLEELGHEVGYYLRTNFYNQDERLTLTMFEKYLAQKSKQGIILGQPSFVSPNPDYLELELKFKDNENFLIWAGSYEDLEKLFRVFYMNAKFDLRNGGLRHSFFVADRNIIGDLDLQSDGFREVIDMRSSDAPEWKMIVDQVYVKDLVIQADKKAFLYPKTNHEETINTFKYLTGQDTCSPVEASRMYYLMAYLQDNSYRKVFGLETGNDVRKEQILKMALTIIKAVGSDFQNRQITVNEFPKKIIHMVGLSKMNGIGKAVRQSELVNLGRMLDTASEVNMSFIFYTISVDECSDIKKSCRHLVLDKVKASRVGATENFPDEVSKVCAVYYETVSKQAYSFKKVSLD